MVTVIREGTRAYLSGDTFPIKDKIKAAGGHWDPLRKMWWVGSVKAAQFEDLAAKATSNPKPQESKGLETRVRARVKYTSKAGKTSTYYLIAESGDGSRLLLISRDGSMQFWADSSMVQVVKRYGREDYRTGYVVYPTIQSLQDYAKQAKEDEANGVDNSWMGNGCSECRRLHDWCPRCAFDEFDN